MKTLLLLSGLLACTLAGRAQTVPFNASAPVRGGAYNQTAVPPTNTALNQSTIQGPTQVQRTTSSYDAQPSRLPEGSVPTAGTPETSPTSVPDPREQPLIMQRRGRQSSDVVPTRGTGSSTIYQNRPPQPTNSSVIVAPQP